MKIKIKSTDSYGESYNKNFELIEILNLPDKREYHYEDEFGKCRIVKSEDAVEIYRRGSINSKQIFKVGKRTAFTYLTREFKTKYEIFTKKMLLNNGKIIMEYDIIDRNEILNSISLEIIPFT